MNHTHTAVIIDDELHAANNLELILNKYCPQVSVIGKAHTLSDGIQLISKTQPQIVFLDISLSANETGFDLLDLLPKKNFHVIFVTAHDNFGMEALKRHAFDYILKPIDYRELVKCIQDLTRMTQKNKSNKPKLIPIPSLDGTHLIHPSDILFCQADGSYTRFYLENDKSLILSKSLRHAEELLNLNEFLRIHRSYIINTTKVNKLHTHDGKYVEIQSHIIPISKSNLEKLSHLYL